MPVGRPSDYKPEYCEMVIEHMAQGLSFESFAGVVSTSKPTLYSWAEKNEEFLNAKRIGTEKCRVFWEKAGIKGLFLGKEEKFNAAVWVFNMKNRFGWRDVQEISQEINNKHQVNLKHEDILELVKKTMKRE